MRFSEFYGCKAILFDFGGTLDSDGEHWLDRFYDLYKNTDFDIPAPEIKRAFYHADSLCYGDSRVVAMGLRPLMAHHVHLQFMALNLEDAGKERQIVENFCSQSEALLRRNARLLSRLKNRYRLGLVSNFYGNVRVVCEEAGLLESLEIILDSAKIGLSKPDPEIFRMALEKLGLPAELVIFVGDSFERDVIPPRQLGMKTIWLKGPAPRIPPHAGPVDRWISSLSALESLLR